MKGVVVWVVVAMLIAAPGQAGKGRGKKGKKAAHPPAAMFEDAEALDGFFAALAAVEDGTARRPARIAILGDSLLAGDQIAGRVRTRLGKTFGDGGPGFVQALPPRSTRHKTVERTSRGTWKLHAIALPLPADRLLGYGGASAESKRSGSIRLRTEHGVTRADVHYLAQPGGGELEVRIDGEVAATLTTDGKAKKAGFLALADAGGIGEIELRARGKVRLFGVTLEAKAGVVVDNLGFKNATARGWGKIRHDHWRGQIARRAPDLFVVMIGSNEAGWLAGKSLDDYQRVVEDLLAPVRAGNPNGSCLVIAPLDQLELEAIVPMVEAQRKAAAAAGCAFWDAYAWMGGARSSLDWYRKKWMNHDFAHPTEAGSRRIADALAAGLLEGYDRYR